MPSLYFEDIAEGDVRDLGSFSLSREEIVAFAERYDPQRIHTDPEFAEAGPYGGLIASGWHTASACMRLIVEGILADADSMGALGMDELRWLAPVRPGDTIDVTNEILETAPSESRDDRGYVTNRTVGTNQDGKEVITMTGVNIFGRRDAE